MGASAGQETVQTNTLETSTKTEMWLMSFTNWKLNENLFQEPGSNNAKKAFSVLNEKKSTLF